MQNWRFLKSLHNTWQSSINAFDSHRHHHHHHYHHHHYDVHWMQNFFYQHLLSTGCKTKDFQNLEFDFFRKPQRSELANLLWAGADMKKQSCKSRWREEKNWKLEETGKIKTSNINLRNLKTQCPYIACVPHFSSPNSNPSPHSQYPHIFHINGICLCINP